MIKHLIALSVLGIAAAASAQAPAKPNIVGKVASVQGVVTVSDGATVGTAVLGMPVAEGSRFVTASTGSTRIAMDNGCDIKLDPNQALTIRSGLDCKALIAAIQSTGGTQAAAAGVGLSRGAALIGHGVLAGAVLIADYNKSNGTPPTPAGGVIPNVPISGQ